MNEPLTVGIVLHGYIAYLAASAVLPIVGALLVRINMLHPSNNCPMCGRRKQWRGRKTWQYGSRRFCPYHDEGEPK